MVGVGVNVLGAPQGLNATSLDDAYSLTHDRVTVACALAGALVRWVDHLEGDVSAVVEAWTQRCMMLGTKVLVDGVEGIARGIDGRGALVVETPGGERRVVAGEVGLIQPSSAMKR